MNNKIKSISYKKNYNAIKNIEEKNTSPKEQAVENTLSVPLFEDEKNSAIKVESIFDELLFSIIPLVLVALPFLLNIHKYSSIAIFFYLSFIVGLGAYMLLKLASPRSFWAIGISVWSALTYLSFVNKTDSLFFPATAFLCFFLTVYALASYFWYGHKERSYATLEYAFYIIHPVLYIAAIYLLVYSKSAYIVGLIDIAIAALYANFAITIKNRDGNRLFVDVSFIVSFIATISAMLVISNSLFQSIILFSIYAFIFSNRAKISQWYLLPILMLTFFKALDSTNYGVKFLPIFNIRFITYLLAAAVFLHAYIATKEGVIHFHNFSRNIKRLSALSFTILLFLGGTLEIADVKRNTEFMPGLLGTGALLAFYLSVAATLYFYGKKHNERTVLGLSIILAIYSLYFLLNYLV